MAKKILTVQYVSLSGTDMSACCDSCELELESEAKDVTTFGSAGWKEFLSGLKSGNLKIKVKQEFTASVDGFFYGIFGTVVAFAVRADQAAVSATNPEFTGYILANQYNPLTGSVGDDAQMSLSFPTSAAVARATS